MAAIGLAHLALVTFAGNAGLVPPEPEASVVTYGPAFGRNYWWLASTPVSSTEGGCRDAYHDLANRLDWKPNPIPSNWTPRKLEWNDGNWDLSFSSRRRQLPFELRFSHLLPHSPTQPVRMGRFLLDVF